MTRIPLADLSQQPDQIRDFVTRRGDLNVFRLLANAPTVFAGWTRMVDELFESPSFTLRTREVLILRVAHLQKSRYELDQHIPVARNAGLSDQQISAIVNAGPIDKAGFTDNERLILQLVTELCITHRLRDASFAYARKIFGEQGVTELLMLISCYYGLALVLNATDLDLDDHARFRP
jgi:4-carboxymuconolactone decarboxylase